MAAVGDQGSKQLPPPEAPWGPPLSAEQCCETLGWPHQPGAWDPGGGGACLRSHGGNLLGRTQMQLRRLPGLASGVLSPPPEGCCRAPSPPLLPGHWLVPPALFCPLCSQETPGSSHSHSSMSKPWYPYSSCPQSFPASVSFSRSQLFASGGIVLE